VLLKHFAEANRVSIQKLSDAIRTASAASAPGPSPCGDAFAHLGKFLAIRQLSLHDLLRPYDRANRGTVTTQDFIRAFDSSRHAQIVAREYAKQNSDTLHYAQIGADIAKAKIVKPVPAAVTAAIERFAKSDVDARVLFEAQDRTHCGSLTPFQFTSVISHSKIGIVPADVKSVIEFYKDDGVVRYLGFVTEIEALRANNQAAAPAAAPEDPLVARLQTVFRNRKVDPSLIFQGVSTSGLIGRYPFVRALAQNQDEVKGEDLNILAHRFDAGNGQVNVRAFIELFEKPPPENRIDASPTIEYIRSELALRKLQLRSALMRLVRGDSDEVPPSVLLVAIQRCGIAISSDRLATLQAAYPGTRGSVNWRKLCLDTDSDFPAVSPEPEPAPAPSSPRRLLPPVSITAMPKLAEYVRELRLDLRTDFTCADRYKTGYVSLADCAQVLSFCVAKFSQVEIDQLCRTYENASTREFDYLSFCRDLDDELARPPPVPTPTPWLVLALKHYRAFVLSRRIDCRTIFQRFDPSNTGHAPSDTVKRAWAASGLHFNESETAALMEAFDEKRNARFQYRRMDEQAAKYTVVPELIPFLLNPEFGIEEMATQRGATLVAIRAKLAWKRMRVRQLFPEGTRTVSFAEFAERIRRVNIGLEHLQLEALQEGYAPGGGPFEWEQFCADCEGIRLVGS
jgi:Ca2+-binding EF-hand superfamily protein